MSLFSVIILDLYFIESKITWVEASLCMLNLRKQVIKLLIALKLIYSLIGRFNRVVDSFEIDAI
jgi:hypothetical protein